VFTGFSAQNVHLPAGRFHIRRRNDMKRLAILFLLLPMAANATLIYDESVSGDIQGDQNNPALLGAFVLGDNTILGFDSIDTDTSSQGDTFGLTLAADQVIDSIVLSITNNSNTADRFTTTVFAEGFTQVEQYIQSPGFTGTVIFSPFATQTPGQYSFSTQFATGDQRAEGFFWEWTSGSAGCLSQNPAPSHSSASACSGSVWQGADALNSRSYIRTQNPA
jgi:hypothetical protein